MDTSFFRVVGARGGCRRVKGGAGKKSKKGSGNVAQADEAVVRTDEAAQKVTSTSHKQMKQFRALKKQF